MGAVPLHSLTRTQVSPKFIKSYSTHRIEVPGHRAQALQASERRARTRIKNFSCLTMAAAAAAQWQLTTEQRAITVGRVSDSITNLAFARGISLSLEEARRAAAATEKTAYTTALVESRTTTGTRPALESLQAYARCSQPPSGVCGTVERPSGMPLWRLGHGNLRRFLMQLPPTVVEVLFYGTPPVLAMQEAWNARS